MGCVQRNFSHDESDPRSASEWNGKLATYVGLHRLGNFSISIVDFMGLTYLQYFTAISLWIITGPAYALMHQIQFIQHFGLINSLVVPMGTLLGETQDMD
jgi:hypothetical protein